MTLAALPFVEHHAPRTSMVACRWRQADEDYDAIATRVEERVVVEIRLPVVDGPDVSRLIDHKARLTHHRDEARWAIGTVQRIAVV